MLVQVFHADVHVANVTITDTNSVESALEKAWEMTNNIGGSWSMGEVLPDGTENYDYHPEVEVMAPLPTHLGRTYGHRSSMVGDLFVVNHELPYKVASCGFEKAE